MKTERDPKYAQQRQFLFQQTLACREEKNKTGTSLQAASENKKNIITLKLFGQMILQLY